MVFHEVSDAILAHLLLLHGFLDVVDSTKVGLIGLSWDRFVACTIVGILPPSTVLFSHDIPAYGCGNGILT